MVALKQLSFMTVMFYDIKICLDIICNRLYENALTEMVESKWSRSRIRDSSKARQYLGRGIVLEIVQNFRNII
jgi:hypothetical protein